MYLWCWRVAMFGGAIACTVATMTAMTTIVEYRQWCRVCVCTQLCRSGAVWRKEECAEMKRDTKNVG